MKNFILPVALFFFAFTANAQTLEKFAVAEPYPLPGIQFTGEQGNIHNLNDFRGKVVLLNFWATWCRPCIDEMPAMDRLAADFSGKYDMEVIPVSIDHQGIGVVQEFYNDYNIKNMGIYMDTGAAAFRELGVRALPVTFILNVRGEVLMKAYGGIDWDAEENRQYLLKLTGRG